MVGRLPGRREQPSRPRSSRNNRSPAAAPGTHGGARSPSRRRITGPRDTGRARSAARLARSQPVVAQQPTPDPTPEHPSPAYLALAQLGRIESRLALSAADCTVLEPLAAQWFARGVDADYLTRALTSGLPAQVGSPIGLVRRRLNDKIPPHLPTTPTPATPGSPVRRLLVECTECGAPGPSEALPDGLCRTCRKSDPDAASEQATRANAERNVLSLVAELRGMLKPRPRSASGMSGLTW